VSTGTARGTAHRAGTEQALVVAIGNPLRRDDGVGPQVVARALELSTAERLSEALNVMGPLSAPLDLFDLWSGWTGLTIVVDSVRSGAPVGELSLSYFGPDRPPPWLCRWSNVVNALAVGHRPSTHGLGVAEVFAILAGMGRAPLHVLLVGVEGEDFSNGEGLTPAVCAAVEGGAALVLDLVRAWHFRE